MTTKQPPKRRESKPLIQAQSILIRPPKRGDYKHIGFKSEIVVILESKKTKLITGLDKATLFDLTNDLTRLCKAIQFEDDFDEIDEEDECDPSPENAVSEAAAIPNCRIKFVSTPRKQAKVDYFS
jgi:hypothetical protein